MLKSWDILKKIKNKKQELKWNGKIIIMFLELKKHFQNLPEKNIFLMEKALVIFFFPILLESSRLSHRDENEVVWNSMVRQGSLKVKVVV